MKKILVGVDATETAAAAARRASEIAVAFDAVLHVTSAFGKQEVEVVEAGSERFVVSTEQEAGSLADEIAGRLKAEFPSLKVVAAAHDGKPATALVDIAETEGIDLIVLGNRRVQGPGRILGSVATGVLAKAPCDVYVVHTHG